MICLPAIDLIEGKCVRLSQGDFSRLHHYEGDPLEVAQSYAKCGATHLHVVDLDGARAGQPRQAALIGRISRSSELIVQSGGGIRTVAQALSLREQGVDRVVVGSLAVKSPATAQAIYEAVGPDHFTLAIDVRLDEGKVPRIATEGWTVSQSESAWDLLETYSKLGLKHLLCTDIDRDGMLEGPNFSLYLSLLARFPHLELQASGGVSSLGDLERLKAASVPAVIIGKALYEGRFRLEEALKC